MGYSPSRRAFSFIEILIAAPLFAALLFCVVQSIAVYTVLYHRLQDEISARNRLDRVHSILFEPISLCGYGMPKDADAFRAAFQADANLTTAFMPDNFYTWPGPLHVRHTMSGTARKENARCYIVHGTPSNRITLSETVVSDDRFTIELNYAPPHLKPANGSSPHKAAHWAVFGAMHPFHSPVWAVNSKNTKVITVGRGGGITGKEPAVIPKNDELYYVQAVRVDAEGFRDDWALYTDKSDGSGKQPRVAGIVDARFEHCIETQTLKVRLLIRGDRRSPEIVTDGTPPGWPPEFAGDIPRKARHYRLYAFTLVFGLHNFQGYDGVRTDSSSGNRL